jgi:hypothetical protein
MAPEQRFEALQVRLLADRILVGAGEQHARLGKGGEDAGQGAQQNLDALLGGEARRESDPRARVELPGFAKPRRDPRVRLGLLDERCDRADLTPGGRERNLECVA